jgi:hypothetical protein
MTPLLLRRAPFHLVRRSLSNTSSTTASIIGCRRRRPLDFNRPRAAATMSTSTTKKAPPPGTAQPVPGDESSMFIKEGQASMIFPKGNEVFYNKVQVGGRLSLDRSIDQPALIRRAD